MSNLHEAFMESVILQAFLAVIFSGTVCYLYATGQDVPEALMGLVGLILGFYFRSKAGAEVRKNIGQ